MIEIEKMPATANLQVISSAALADEATSAQHRQLAANLRLGNLLHSSLDLNEVLRLFARELQRELATKGLHYNEDNLGIDIDIAETGIHRAQYRLEADGTELGQLQLSRDKRFTKRELERMELMIGCLVPALRNALQYMSAMQTATRDSLTQVGNRVALEITADREIAMARRTGQPTAILVLDIDHFKSINDTYGHSAGDRVLIDVAQQLRENCREVDSIFRFGGEEFVVLLSQTEEIGATAIAERIRLAVANMNTQYQQQTIQITASIGIACLSRGEGLPAWFERADRALYLAKKSGRNRVMRAAQRSIA
ncbi:MAG TPA: GGDEF domain-containing protein [Spongiibacteraceae bacterium]|nr:GGDEF domain-containing protein [Spongiibacteraceae bacterium]